MEEEVHAILRLLRRFIISPNFRFLCAVGLAQQLFPPTATEPQQVQPVSSSLCSCVEVLSTVMNFQFFLSLMRFVEAVAFVAVGGNASMLEAVLHLK